MRSFRVLKTFVTPTHRFHPGTQERPNIVREDMLAGGVAIEEWLRTKTLEEIPASQTRAPSGPEPTQPEPPRPAAARAAPPDAIPQQGRSVPRPSPEAKE